MGLAASFRPGAVAVLVLAAWVVARVGATRRRFRWEPRCRADRARLRTWRPSRGGGAGAPGWTGSTWPSGGSSTCCPPHIRAAGRAPAGGQPATASGVGSRGPADCDGGAHRRVRGPAPRRHRRPTRRPPTDATAIRPGWSADRGRPGGWCRRLPGRRARRAGHLPPRVPRGRGGAAVLRRADGRGHPTAAGARAGDRRGAGRCCRRRRSGRHGQPGPSAVGGELPVVRRRRCLPVPLGGVVPPRDVGTRPRAGCAGAPHRGLGDCQDPARNRVEALRTAEAQGWLSR